MIPPRTAHAPILFAGLVLPALALSAHGVELGSAADPVGVHGAAEHDTPQVASLPGSAYLHMLPEGPVKRRFILDCTGCHVWTEEWVKGADGQPRTTEQWATSIEKMTSMFGSRTGFPIVSSWTDPDILAPWLAEHFSGTPDPVAVPAGVEPPVPPSITEFEIPMSSDLPHDVMVDPEGHVLVTGMFTHRMYRLDPETARFNTVDIPVPEANPRAVDLDAEGRWVVLLGGPGGVARYDPRSQAWESWEVGVYPHSVVSGSDGRIWWNGHFTVDPEVIGSLDPATGEVTRYEIPPLDGADTPPGESTIPYGLRQGPDGVIWATQLLGGHLIRLDPSTGDIRQWKMPTAHAGPRRPDVSPDGTVWIPEYSAGKLARFDPETERFTEWDLPVPDALPYVVRVDQQTGRVWIGTGHGDFLASFDPDQERFTVYPLPTRGALIRHLDVDERRGEVWAAYGASPGIPSKIVRLRPSPAVSPT